MTSEISLTVIKKIKNKKKEMLPSSRSASLVLGASILFIRKVTSFTLNNPATQRQQVKRNRCTNLILFLEQHPILVGQGITSSVFVKTKSNSSYESHKKNILFAGTKRGNVLSFDIGNLKTELEEVRKEMDANYNVEFDIFQDDKYVLKPYPIYSMEAFFDNEEKKTMLACGGGDRFITIWENEGQCEDNDSWKIKCRLGPHTGWVKDLVLEPNRQHSNALRLHSIGCNCIETWKYEKEEPGEFGHSKKTWKHDKKRTIESCPNQGATLSSDLLCLCLDLKDASGNYFLYSGGVDGRIHEWYGDEMKPKLSFIAHNGRVNALLILQKARVMISSGYDGVIKCWDLSNEMGLAEASQKKDVYIAINGRVLSMSCIDEASNEAEVILGTSCGKIYTISVFRNKDGNVSMEVHKSRTFHIRGGAGSVYQLTSLSNLLEENKVLDIVVAHANGLTVINSE